MEMLIWNTVLSGVIALLVFFLKEKSSEIKRIDILLNKTREEVAKDYVTKGEVHADIDRLMNRLELLDAKLDRIIENSNRNRG